MSWAKALRWDGARGWWDHLAQRPEREGGDGLGLIKVLLSGGQFLSLNYPVENLGLRNDEGNLVGE